MTQAATPNGVTPQKNPNDPPVKRRFGPIIAMLLLFGLPYLLAWHFVFSDEPIFQLNQQAHGTLVSPMQPVDLSVFTLLDGSTLTPPAVDQQWAMLTVINMPCDDSCMGTLYTMQQTRRAIGVQRRQIERLVLINTPITAEEATHLETQFPGTRLIQGTPAARESLTTLFSHQVPEVIQGLYLVDPYGNYMLAYPADLDPKGLISDLQRLLKNG